MTERPLMSPDELKSMKPGSFIVMKTGAHPFISKLKLFTKWGIAFDKGAYTVPDKATRTVYYAGRDTIMAAVDKAFPGSQSGKAGSFSGAGGAVFSEHSQVPEVHTEPKVKTSA